MQNLLKLYYLVIAATIKNAPWHCRCHYEAVCCCSRRDVLGCPSLYCWHQEETRKLILLGGSAKYTEEVTSPGEAGLLIFFRPRGLLKRQYPREFLLKLLQPNLQLATALFHHSRRAGQQSWQTMTGGTIKGLEAATTTASGAIEVQTLEAAERKE